MREKIFQNLLKLFLGCYVIMLIILLLARSERGTLFFEGALLLFAFIMVFQHYKGGRFSYWIFFSALFLRIFIILVNNVTPESDFSLMYEAAQHVSNGGKNLENWAGTYFSDWAYQTGFVLYETLILKIWNSIWALKIMNCIFGAGINVLIYHIAKFLWKGEKEAQVVAILYLIFPFSLLHTSILSNAHISAFFLYLGIYFLRCKTYQKKYTGVILAAICMAIGNIMRPDAIVFLVSLIVFVLFEILSDLTWKNVGKFLVRFIIFGVIYSGIINVTSLGIQLNDINSEGLANNDPLYKFSVGLDYETKGTYSEKTLNLIQERQEQYGSLEMAHLSIIKERTKFSLNLLDLMFQKIGLLWWGNDWMYWNYSDWPNMGILKCIAEINYTVFWGIIVLVALSVKSLYTIAKKDRSVLLLPFITFSSFCVYLLIEVQSRYAYLPQIAFFIVAAGGIKTITDNIEKYKKMDRY